MSIKLSQLNYYMNPYINKESDKSKINNYNNNNYLTDSDSEAKEAATPVSYTHLTLPTNREV